MASFPLQSGQQATSFRFGDFELWLDSGELLRSGAVVKLQPRPARVLEVLARHAGEVVPREEIRRAVWGDETYVDFDLSLNFCIHQIRLALGDSAEQPRFVATVPRRGYRFVAPVTAIESDAAPAASARTAEPRTSRQGWRATLQVAGALALVLIALGFVARPRSQPPTDVAALADVSSAARKPYEDGRYFAAQDQNEKATALFEEAAVLDPHSSAAFASLAQVLLGTGRPASEILPIAGAAEQRALELDARNFVAHVDRGQRLFQYELDWRGAEKEFRRAIELERSSAQGHYGLARVLASRGRYDEALDEVGRALALEPERLGIRSGQAWLYYLARRYDEAIALARRTIALESTLPRGAGIPFPLRSARRTLILSELAKGDAPAAFRAASEQPCTPAVPPPASLAEFWQHRKRAAAEVEAARPWLAVLPAIELGDYDHALGLLERQCKERSGTDLPFLRVDPLYDPLRGLPRFAELLRCAGI